MINKLEQLKKELQQLDRAYKSNLLTTSEYCSIYHAISQQIKKLS